MRQGDEIHGEAISTDASGGVDVTLYPSGSLTALTLADNQRVVVTDLTISCATASVVSVLAGSAGDGRYIAHGHMANLSQRHIHLRTPYFCPAGEVPQLKSGGAVACSVIVQGYIVEV